MKIKWLVDCAENTAFFHATIKFKNRKNRIHGLVIDGAWNTNPKDIMQEVHNFFANKFHKKWPERPKLISNLFKTLSSNQIDALDSPFLIEEVKQAVRNCGGDKAPGQDGYTFKILKNKWELIKYDLYRFARHFESYGCFARGCNSSFITLIPKVNDPLDLGDYRPINLIGCLYKVIAKILASRLKMVVDSVINDVQSTYI